MPLFRVELDMPHHGWMLLHFYAQGEHLAFEASAFFDGLNKLVQGLLRVAQDELPTRVQWAGEPEELVFNFAKAQEKIELSIAYQWIREGTHTVEFHPIAGTREEICLPFRSALRSLELRLEGIETSQRDWYEGFPYRELALLTEQLGKS